MKRWMLAVVVSSALVACGTSSSSTTSSSSGCPPTAAAGDQMPIGGNGMCASVGGTCMTQAAYTQTCPPGYREANVGMASCGYYGNGGGNGCYAMNEGIASMPIPCCVADDAGADAAADAPDDAPAKIGSCAGAPCAEGCACGLAPQSGAAYCLCVDAGSGAPDASEAPNCGTIYCYAGCTCADAHASKCTC